MKQFLVTFVADAHKKGSSSPDLPHTCIFDLRHASICTFTRNEAKNVFFEAFWKTRPRGNFIKEISTLKKKLHIYSAMVRYFRFGINAELLWSKLS